MYHRDNPPSGSILEEATNSTVIPFMPVMNNLVLFDQHKPQNSPESVVPDLDLTDGVGKIVYADDQLTVAAQIKLDGNPFDLSIRELFGPKSPYRQRYELKGTMPASFMTLIA